MAARLLFIFGIVVAHGALAAGWMSQERPAARVAAATCVNVPAPTPDYSPEFQIYALNLARPEHGEVLQP